MLHKLINQSFVKYGLLSGAVIFIVKASIYATGNLSYRFNPVYTLGTAVLIILGLTLAFRESTEVKLSNYLFRGLALVAIVVTLSSTCDQLFYQLNPEIPKNIKALTVEQFEELESKFDGSVFEEGKKELIKSNPNDMVGLMPFLLYIFNASLLNFFTVFGVSLYFWLRVRKANRQIGHMDQ